MTDEENSNSPATHWEDYFSLKYLILLGVLAVILTCTVVFRRLLYVVVKTFPRDMRGVSRFIRVAIHMRRAQRHNSTVSQQFDNIVRQHPHKVCFYFEDEQWTFKQVQEVSFKVANYFQGQGYKKGDPIALLMENHPYYVSIWLGLSRLGVVPALINYNLRLQPLRHSFEIINCKAVIFSHELTEAVREVLGIGGLSGTPLYDFVRNSRTDSLRDSIDLSAALNNAPTTEIKITEKITLYDPLYYMYTSGTTGLPKAAVIKHLRFIVASAGCHHVINIKSGDIQYTTLPLYHTAAGLLGMGQALLFGTSIVLRSKFSASNFWSDCIKYNVTVVQYIGEICKYLMSQPECAVDREHKVRTMYGNGLRAEIWQSFVTRFNITEICELYGSTEGNCNMINIDSRVGAVGFLPRLLYTLLPMGLIRVDNETGEPLRDPKTGLVIRCKPNEFGELVGKIIENHPTRDFHGYGYEDAKSKANKILADVFSKGDSWFRSGDILVMDEFGYFYFKDRTGDTFRWKGENVSTAEVESVISNICGLKDAVVYGVVVTGSEGRAGMLAIADPEGSLNLDSLQTGISKSLPTYARPLFLRILKSIELTGTYKMKKLDLQKEGYDVNQVKEPLYLLQGGKYVQLDLALYKQLISGSIRL